MAFACGGPRAFCGCPWPSQGTRTLYSPSSAGPVSHTLSLDSTGIFIKITIYFGTSGSDFNPSFLKSMSNGRMTRHKGGNAGKMVKLWFFSCG